MRPHLKIIFVCRGNIYRSPIAEEFFKKELAKRNIRDIEVDSYGLQGFILEPPKGKCLRDYPIEYRLSKPILDKKEINISHRIAKPLSKKIIDESDLIVVMSLDVKKVLTNKFPEIKCKLLLLANLPDPAGSNNSNTYEKVINDIEYFIAQRFYQIINYADRKVVLSDLNNNFLNDIMNSDYRWRTAIEDVYR